MPTRKINFAPEEYYHIYNRGVLKQNIFLDDRDRIRFLFLILHLQSKIVPYNISRQVACYVRHRMFNNSDILGEIIKKRMVELVAFALMSNHFHLLVKETVEGGISKYLQKVLNAYTKYFNTKYQRSGHLFQGPFRAGHIQDDNQLLHVSAYIHRNPREIKKWRNTDHLYPWSSFQDYVGNDRWGSLIPKSIISDQFSNGKEYHRWVVDSVAKSEYVADDLEC